MSLSDFNTQLSELAQADQLRVRRIVDGPQDASMVVDGKRVVNYASNDYLGLASHPRVVAAFQAAAARYGVGSGASHLVCGHSALHHQLEEALAEFTGRPRALLFSSGYMANTGILASLLQRGDHVLLMLGNVPPLWDVMLACMKLGAVIIPATTLLTADDLRERRALGLDAGDARAQGAMA